jgi:hypothetical protein
LLHTLRQVARRVVPRRFRPGRGEARKPDAFAAVRAVDGPVLVPRIAVRVDDGEGRDPRLVVLIPTLELRRLTGGPNTALNLGAEVAARGMPVRFVATHGPASPDAELSVHVGALTGSGAAGLPVTFESVAKSRELRLGRTDVVLATWWPTAHVAARAIEATGVSDFLYLVQDFEPAFYPWSTNYALALQTYAMPMRAICNTSLLRDHLVGGRIGRFADAPAADISVTFEPAVDRQLFRRRTGAGPRRLLFYARPGKPRNAFELGLAALRSAVQAGAFAGDWEFWAIGEPVPELPLGPGTTLQPMPWRSLADYGELLGTSDVLLSLMLSPHPSYPPLEMAAAGGHVVTNTFGVKTAAAMARFSPRITAVPPDVAELAAALAAAASLPRPGDAPPMALPASWQAALAPAVDWILAAGPARR